MTQCISYCLLGAALLGSMIMTMLASKKSKRFTDFMSLLDEDQQRVYKSIIKERMTIYIQGLVLGVILAIAVTFNTDLSKSVNICLFVVISLGINLAYYEFYPKSTYMLNHLNSNEQVNGWLNIYREMKLRSKLGFVLGILGYIILGMGWCH